jgi:predicted ArsR family transcriptional regulator
MSERRDAILEALHQADLDVTALASAAGVHANTVRWHLAALERDGLVDHRPEHAGRRGRPRDVYRLTAAGRGWGRNPYRVLAGVLARAVGESGSPYEAGRSWGDDLAAGAPARTIVELLDAEGFDAEDRGDAIAMRRCPFAALAAECPQVVCALHRGVIDGALAATGSGRTVERLQPWAEPGVCVAKLAG